jgi:hypothetical protein
MRSPSAICSAVAPAKDEKCERSSLYRFLEGTVEKYMTRAVRTVTRQTTMRELGALFEKYNFNSFP